MLVNIDALNKDELGRLAGRIVLAVGMTPAIIVAVPPPVDGISWQTCYDRGLERLAHPEGLS